ncbi:MAG: helix-turn-helix transcriptional regulator [Clostridia bacterium]|nr:helix-turn-helix transcriptional regulator [Clostridia bacterium]
MGKKTIGGFIAALRKASGMTQKDLAEKLNVSDKTVSRWERDDSAPDLSVIPVIAEVFGVTCDELLRGERKSPGQQAESPGDTPTAKGEKQRQRLLTVTLSKYKTRSLIAGGIALVGLLAAMAFNFGFNRAYLGFLAGCVFYLAAAICQAIFLNGAFLSVADQEDTGDFKRQVIALAEGVLALTAVLLFVSLPLVLFVFDAYAGMSGSAWLRRGSVFGLSGLNLCAIVLWLVNGQLVRRGAYAPKANFSHNHRWQRNCALILTALLAVTFACQWGFNQFVGARGLAEWDAFDNVNNFRTYIESDVEYERNHYSGMNSEPIAQPDQAITYYDEFGNVISEEEALTDHLYDGGEVFLTYVRRNEAVRDIRYSIKDGEILFLETLTWDNYYRAQTQLNTFNMLFCTAYVAEYLLALWFYLVKRKKA